MNNILYIPTRYFPAISGAEFYIQRIAEIFQKSHSYDVKVITSNAIDFKALRNSKGKTIEKKEKYYNRVNNIPIKRFSVDYTQSFKEKLKLIRDLPSFEKLNLSDGCVKKFILNGPFLDNFIDTILNEEVPNIDLIHTTFYPYFNLVMALCLSKALNIPAVCTPFFHFSNPRYNDPQKLEVLEKFDLLVACTKIEKRELLRKLNIPSSNIEVIPMGVDFKIFDRVHKKTYKDFSFKKKFFEKKETNYDMVLYCGYKNFEKGAISILKSIPYILQKYKKVYFVFIGPPTMAFNRELSKIKEEIEAKIINFTPDNLSGYFDKIKLTAFKESEIYLMPSRSDAFGIAYLEAWASGKPVIGANIGATPEVIKTNIDGLLVEFDNPIDIAYKVLYLLKKKRIRKKLGKNGRTRVQNNYTWEIIAQKTHKMYQNLLKQKM